MSHSVHSCSSTFNIGPRFLLHSFNIGWTSVTALEFQVTLENELHLLSRYLQVDSSLQNLPKMNNDLVTTINKVTKCCILDSTLTDHLSFLHFTNCNHIYTVGAKNCGYYAVYDCEKEEQCKGGWLGHVNLSKGMSALGATLENEQ